MSLKLSNLFEIASRIRLATLKAIDMQGYIDEVLRVGESDDFDMREFAWCQLKAGDKVAHKLDPRVQLWNI